VQKDSGYHLRKYRLASKAGIRLMQFWEDEWKGQRRAVIKSMLAGLCVPNSNRVVYARHCEVRECPQKDAASFFAANHLQGATKMRQAWGLYLGDELVAAASVATTRDGRSTELNRFCTVLNTRVQGGFTKLLSKMPKPLITFSDNRYSEGDLYANSGFRFDGNLSPEYELFRNGQRWSKRSIEAKLPGVPSSEYNLHGYHYLYDAGKKRWLLE
jgi:hypothetical protein